MSEQIPVILSAHGLDKCFVQGSSELVILQQLALDIRRGEKVAVVGRSGSGKSTLLHILAGLDSPDAGVVEIAGENIVAANNNRRAAIRRQSMGFVYQHHHLLPEFTARENIAMPLRLGGISRAEADAEADRLLAEVELADRATHMPAALSGGERQRVAVARALAGAPQIVMADEPTGNLDAHNAQQVMALIDRLSRSHATAFLVVTHDTQMLDQFDRVLSLQQGRLHPLSDVSLGSSAGSSS